MGMHWVINQVPSSFKFLHFKNQLLWPLQVSRPFLLLYESQGSMNGECWVDLKVHKNDISLSKSGQIASWPVDSHAASFPYQMFRLLLRGPNASIGGNQNTFHLSTLELYGHFYRLWLFAFFCGDWLGLKVSSIQDSRTVDRCRVVICNMHCMRLQVDATDVCPVQW